MNGSISYSHTVQVWTLEELPHFPIHRCREYINLLVIYSTMVERYKPPSEFQEVEVEPILKEALSDSRELWLIQVPLTQFEPADFAGKQLSLKLNKEDGWMGCLENSHGKPYDIFGLGKRGIERFAFMPSSSTSMGVRKIDRHICLLKSTSENGDASRIADSSVGFSGSQIQDSVKSESISRDQGTSLGSIGKSSQVASGITFEGEEPSAKGLKKSLKDRKLNGTPTTSYSKSLEESGAYDSSDPQGHSPRTNEYTKDTYTGGKRKKLKSESPKK